LIVRPANNSDAERIACVHLQAWEESYRGLIPDAAFALHSADTRVAQWRATLGNPAVLVHVAERDGVICGFGSGGRSRGLSTASEIYTFYLLDAVKRQGIGRMLFLQLRDALAARGFESLGLWVLTNNMPARRFYQAMGGRAGETRIDRRGDLAFEDIAYIWDDIARPG
jgi:ribosomal protein S18 acetylase RimI-like enzyme